MHFPASSEFFKVSFEGLGINFNISRVAFYIGNFPIYWYAICIATGFLLAVIFAGRKCKLYNIDFDKLLDVTLVSAVIAIIGARLYYVIPKYNELYKGDFWSIFNIRDGGLGIYGGIICAFLSGFVMCKIKKISIGGTFDIAAVGFLIGQGIGRIGNFFNQEAFGYNTDLPWGMYSSKTSAYLTSAISDPANQNLQLDPSAPVHPCFLYEMIWCLLGALILSLLMKKRKYNGQIFLGYCIWYGTGRFFIESLRTDSLMTLGGAYKLSQLVAIMLILIAVIMMIYFGWKAKKSKNDNLEYVPQFAAASESVASEGEKIESENTESVKEDVQTVETEEIIEDGTAAEESNGDNN